MILEAAILNVKPTLTRDFEVAFEKAQKIIAGMPGYRGHQLQQCIEDENKISAVG